MKRIAALLVAAASLLSALPADAADGWKAGAAKVVITPTVPVWMSGYPRDHPAEGTDQDLWAKALAVEDPQGRRAVLITMDLRVRHVQGNLPAREPGTMMAYIPSLRVLREGGYEGANSQVYYSMPARWSEDIESQIVEQVHRECQQIAATAPTSATGE